MEYIGGTMKILSRDEFVYQMSSNNEPKMHVSLGETFKVETSDCFNGQISNEGDVLANTDDECFNPATGPIYIEGVETGDILKVHILDIEVNEYGVIAVTPGFGTTGEYHREEMSKIIPINNNKATFNENIDISIDPMVGVIGTAPSDSCIMTVIPGSHGGNMDCKRITKGSTVLLPVNVEGGLLSIGDLHAAMGDGEVCGCGIEIAGEVTLKVEVLKNRKLPLPLVLTKESIITIASQKTLDEASKLATIKYV